MNDAQLNLLVYEYQQGNEQAINDLCREVIPKLTKISEAIWYKLSNNAEFECRCIRKLQRSLRSFDISKGNARSLIYKIIVRERSEYLSGKRGRKRPDTIAFEQLAMRDDEGNETDYEIHDVLADVESQVSLKEKTALLAQGDSRKKLILKAWIQGCYSDSDISVMLAHQLGGKAESHRKFIQRFRNECKVLIGD